MPSHGTLNTDPADYRVGTFIKAMLERLGVLLCGSSSAVNTSTERERQHEPGSEDD
jgi:hypothetical protein